ncbi:putative PX domain protein [Trichinella nativa]|uniref:Putative PX domain protein n=1 Tax=Trichinella nativa TaxID=6335 RepID=A0A1Y3ELS2_9BILA|nr:putative PX domain protein [Trichinella nativa]
MQCHSILYDGDLSHLVMLHISIPSSRQATDSSGKAYTIFEIYINNAYHCSSRYSQLLRLHEIIKKIIPKDVPNFPPKYINALAGDRLLNERREALQEYLRTVFSIKEVTGHIRVQQFFLDAQRICFIQESASLAARQLSNEVPVYLLDGSKYIIQCYPGDSTNVLLERLAVIVGLPIELTRHFGLFIVTKSELFGGWKTLSAHCYPFFMLQIDCVRLKVRVLHFMNDIFDQVDIICRQGCLAFASRKCRWQSIDEKYFISLMKNTDAVNNQDEVYPKLNTVAHVAVGNRRLLILHEVSQARRNQRDNFSGDPYPFLATSIHGSQDLSFEYLFSNNHLEWITLRSSQSVLISRCLQSMIEEIVNSQADAIASASSKNTMPMHSGVILNELSFESANSSLKPKRSLHDTFEIGLVSMNNSEAHD